MRTHTNVEYMVVHSINTLSIVIYVDLLYRVSSYIRNVLTIGIEHKVSRLVV